MMDVPLLLSSKDFNIIQSAFDHCKEYVIPTRTMDGYSISVSVLEAPTVWGQPMLIQVKQSKPNVDEIKNCRSVEELRRYLKHESYHD